MGVLVRPQNRDKSSQLKMGVLVLKRTSDKLDAVFAGAFLILGLAVFGIYLGAARLTCVPTSCQGRPSSANCARDWVYLSAQCEKTFLAYPDTNFHYLLLLASFLWAAGLTNFLWQPSLYRTLC